MKDLLKALIPIQFAFSVGKMRLLAVSMFDRDAEEDEIGTEGVTVGSGVALGFAMSPIDELNPRLTPLEDD